MATKTVARLASEGFFKTLLEDIRAAGTWKAERIITSPQAAKITVQGSSVKVLPWCACSPPLTRW